MFIDGPATDRLTLDVPPAGATWRCRARGWLISAGLCVGLAGCQGETPSGAPPQAAPPQAASSASAAADNTPLARRDSTSRSTSPSTGVPAASTAELANATPADAVVETLPTFFADDEAEGEIVRPEVILSAGHLATCRVKPGDTFPDLQLTTLDGSPAALSTHLGKTLTIVVFWSRQQPMSVEQIRRLQQEFTTRYRDAGVSVVTIEVGDGRDEVQEFLAGVPATYVTLLDPEAVAFQQVAAELMPRTYLLRPDLSVVWLDVEYSRSTRRELKNAILFVLKQSEQQAHSGQAPRM